jgi:hypothetical protein
VAIAVQRKSSVPKGQRGRRPLIPNSQIPGACSSHLGRAALISVPRKRHTARLLTDAVNARRAEAEAQIWAAGGLQLRRIFSLPGVRTASTGKPEQAVGFLAGCQGRFAGPAWLLRLRSLLGARNHSSWASGPLFVEELMWGGGSSFPAREALQARRFG